MSTFWTEVLGAIAACLTTGAFFPQAIQTLRTRQTAGLSLPAYAVFSTGVLLWLVYGVLIMSWPLIIANTITLVPQLTIMALILKDRAAVVPSTTPAGPLMPPGSR